MLRPALLLLGLVSVLALGGASGGALGETPEPSPSPSPSLHPTEPSPTAVPVDDFPSPAPIPSASPVVPYPGSLHIGDWVQVTGTGDCLNVRGAPGLTVEGVDLPAPMPVLNCLPDGFVGRLGGYPGDATEMPVLEDGHWWWRLLGQGWVAEDWLAFHHAGGFPWPERPDLAAAGLIAYQNGKDGSIWLVNADGSSPRKLAERRDTNEYISEPQWSPDGSRLMFTATGFTPDKGQTIAVRVIDVGGTVVAEFPGITQPAWSPDGGRIAGYRFESAGGMMGQYGVPVVLDVASGATSDIGSRNFYWGRLTWSPDGARVAYICTTSTYTPFDTGGQPGAEVRLVCGGDGLRTVLADGSDTRIVLPIDASVASYANPNWSPDGKTIAVASHSEASGCRGIALVDAEAGGVTRCLPFPAPGGMGGGCGGGDDGATEWNPDSRYLIYHTEFGAGANGIFVNDLATGDNRLIPAAPVWFVSLSGDGRHLVFGAEGYIWSVGVDGADRTLLGEGISPAWQPVP